MIFLTKTQGISGEIYQVNSIGPCIYLRIARRHKISGAGFCPSTVACSLDLRWEELAVGSLTVSRYDKETQNFGLTQGFLKKALCNL